MQLSNNRDTALVDAAISDESGLTYPASTNADFWSLPYTS